MDPVMRPLRCSYHSWDFCSVMFCLIVGMPGAQTGLLVTQNGMSSVKSSTAGVGAGCGAGAGAGAGAVCCVLPDFAGETACTQFPLLLLSSSSHTPIFSTIGRLHS